MATAQIHKAFADRLLATLADDAPAAVRDALAQATRSPRGRSRDITVSGDPEVFGYIAGRAKELLAAALVDDRGWTSAQVVGASVAWERCLDAALEATTAA